MAKSIECTAWAVNSTIFLMLWILGETKIMVNKSSPAAEKSVPKNANKQWDIGPREKPFTISQTELQ